MKPPLIWRLHRGVGTQFYSGIPEDLKTAERQYEIRINLATCLTQDALITPTYSTYLCWENDEYVLRTGADNEAFLGDFFGVLNAKGVCEDHYEASEERWVEATPAMYERRPTPNVPRPLGSEKFDDAFPHLSRGQAYIGERAEGGVWATVFRDFDGKLYQRKEGEPFEVIYHPPQQVFEFNGPLPPVNDAIPPGGSDDWDPIKY